MRRDLCLDTNIPQMDADSSQVCDILGFLAWERRQQAARVLGHAESERCAENASSGAIKTRSISANLALNGARC